MAIDKIEVLINSYQFMSIFILWQIQLQVKLCVGTFFFSFSYCQQTITESLSPKW